MNYTALKLLIIALPFSAAYLVQTLISQVIGFIVISMGLNDNHIGGLSLFSFYFVFNIVIGLLSVYVSIRLWLKYIPR